MSSDLDKLKKPEIEKDLQAASIGALREAAKPLRKDLRNFAGSRLTKRTGKTAKTIKVGVRKRKGGAIMELKGSGALNIWEFRGRKGFQIPKRKPVTVKMPSGRILNLSPKDPIKVPATGPRPVLQPGLKKNQANINKLLANATGNAVEDLMPDKIVINSKNK